MEKKLWYTSKTLWVNVVAAITSLVADQFGYTLSAEMTSLVFVAINWILRFITKEEIVWNK